MITLRCGLRELPIDDVKPPFVLFRGVPKQVPIDVLHQSQKLKAAVRRGEVKVTRHAKPPGGGMVIIQNKVPVDVATKADIEKLHNLFVSVGKQSGGELSANGELKELLQGVAAQVADMKGRLDRMEQGTTVQRLPVERRDQGPEAPVFIPSEIRTGEVVGSSLEAQSQVEDVNLSEAERKLRDLRGDK